VLLQNALKRSTSVTTQASVSGQDTSVTVIMIVETGLMKNTAVSDISVCLSAGSCYLNIERSNRNWNINSCTSIEKSVSILQQRKQENEHKC